jgi:hypothetical protein
MGLSSSKTKTTTDQTQNQSATTTPQNPAWVTDSITDWVGRIGAFGDADPNSFVAPASPLQQQAWNNVGQLNGWKGQMQSASGLGFKAANAGANLVGKPSTYSPTKLGAAAQATAGTGADNMGRYMNPWLNDVVNTSLADFDHNAGMTRATQAAQGAKAGAFGGSRWGIREAATEGELARARGSLDANLRATGFNTAAGLGMADADRSTANSQFNAGNQNNFSLAQAGMDTDAARYGADAANRAAEFNAGQQDNALNRGIQGAAGLADIASQYGAGTRADLGLMAGFGDQQRGIEQAYRMAPAAQLDMMGNLLGGTPFSLFNGQTVNGTSQTSGTSVTKSSPSLFDSILAAGQVAASFSDRRLKTNIEKVGEFEDGLGVYDFDYVWGGRHRGVMADEVAELRPHALGPTFAGFATVNYGAL